MKYLSKLSFHPSQGLKKSSSSKTKPEIKMPRARRWNIKHIHLKSDDELQNVNSNLLRWREKAMHLPPAIVSHKEIQIKVRKGKQLTPWLWLSPMGLKSNSLTLPIRLAILLPVSPAPAAAFWKISNSTISTKVS